jgi:argininosuccinate lyase
VTRGASFGELKSSELSAFHPLLTEQLMERMSVESVAESRKSFGGSSQRLIAEAIEQGRKQFKDDPD